MACFVTQKEKHGEMIWVNEASGFISLLGSDLSIEYTMQLCNLDSL